MGAAGTGMLDVLDQGAVEIEDALRIWSTGTVNLDGGTITAPTIDHTRGGQFNFDGGTLHVDLFQGNLINSGGTLGPGRSLGTTTIAGNYTQHAGAALQIELGGTAPGQSDLLAITGSATPDGTLAVALLDGFTPTAGDVFEILTAAGGITGTFASELLPALSGGLLWNVLYSSNSVTLAVAAPGLPGDFNNDGVVDAADYVLWRKNPGDFGGDPDGHNEWRANFGQTLGSGSSLTATVPEPASALLLMLGAAFAIGRVHRHAACAPRTRCRAIHVINRRFLNDDPLAHSAANLLRSATHRPPHKRRRCCC